MARAPTGGNPLPSGVARARTPRAPAPGLHLRARRRGARRGLLEHFVVDRVAGGRRNRRYRLRRSDGRRHGHHPGRPRPFRLARLHPGAVLRRQRLLGRTVLRTRDPPLQRERLPLRERHGLQPGEQVLRGQVRGRTVLLRRRLYGRKLLQRRDARVRILELRVHFERSVPVGAGLLQRRLRRVLLQRRLRRRTVLRRGFAHVRQHVHVHERCAVPERPEVLRRPLHRRLL